MLPPELLAAIRAAGRAQAGRGHREAPFNDAKRAELADILAPVLRKLSDARAGSPAARAA